MNIEAVIPYCSYDNRFFKVCIENLMKLNIRCNVVVYDRLYAGEKENREVLDASRRMFVGKSLFSWSQLVLQDNQSPFYHEAYARYIITKYVVNENCDYILYIDIDEIVDAYKMKLWLDNFDVEKYTAFKLGVYTYSLSATYRLNVKAYNTIMCKASYAKSLPFKIDGRLQYFNNDNLLSRWTAKLGLNKDFYVYRGEPFIHHYTGVRSKEEMIKKVTNWGHRNDRNDWVEVIENEFIVKGNKIGKHTFKIVENKFNL